MEEDKGKDLYNEECAIKFKKSRSNDNLEQGWIEQLKLIPILTDEHVIDAGCGHGTHTKMLREITKGRVIGIDISKEQLKLAEQHPEADKYGKIEYYLADMTQDICAQIEIGENYFSVANSNFVLQHSHSKGVLLSMISNVCKTLKKGGVYVGAVLKVDLTKEIIDANKVKGYEMRRADPSKPLENGEPIQSIVASKDGSVFFEITDYYYDEEVYKNAFLEGGFSGVEFFHEEQDRTTFKATK